MMSVINNWIANFPQVSSYKLIKAGSIMFWDFWVSSYWVFISVGREREEFHLCTKFFPHSSQLVKVLVRLMQNLIQVRHSP